MSLSGFNGLPTTVLIQARTGAAYSALIMLGCTAGGVYSSLSPYHRWEFQASTNTINCENMILLLQFLLWSCKHLLSIHPSSRHNVRISAVLAKNVEYACYEKTNQGFRSRIRDLFFHNMHIRHFWQELLRYARYA